MARTRSLRELIAEVRAAASAFEAGRWSGDDCAALAEEWATAGKACEAAAARAATRALACGQGDVEWVARSSGATPARARDALAITGALDGCPATSAAVASGVVSLTQAREIVAAEAVAPGAEVVLLEVAASTGMAGLREASRKVRLATVDREELHRRQWAARSLGYWVDGDGMVAGRFRLPPEIGLPLVRRLDRVTDRVHRAARRRGDRAPREAHAVDALAEALRGDDGQGRSAGPDVVFVCSLDTYRRGRTEGDELCHVVGGGPVPVGVAREAVGATRSSRGS